MSDNYTFCPPELPSFALSSYELSSELADYDYVGVAERADGHRIHLHRHHQTRQWLNLDERGHPYQFAGIDPVDSSQARFVRSLRSTAATLG